MIPAIADTSPHQGRRDKLLRLTRLMILVTIYPSSPERGMRKLVTIRTVSEIIPIEGADAIEAVKIDGWQCVAKKGEFKPGDNCVYFEVDSFLPACDERFDFMAGRGQQTNGDGSKGYRLRTIKLLGQLSQGLALPTAMFKTEIMLADGEDISEAIGVKKYEPAMPAQLSGQAKGAFPAFLKKTDQERIQNMPWVLSDTQEWEVTQKLDGSSCSVFWNDGVFGVCSRNLELKETEENSFWQVANRYHMRELLERTGRNLCLQGELVGPGIQGNPHALSQIDFFLFDIWDIDQSRYLNPSERHIVLNDNFPGIRKVPLVAFGTLGGLVTADDVLRFAEDQRDRLNPKNCAPEGVVFKRGDGQLSFKAISNKYLLREK